MLLNYQYRAYPTTEQKQSLNRWLRICQYWYNWQLGDRFQWYEQNRCAVNACPLTCSIAYPRDKPNKFSQKKLLPILKQDLFSVSHSGELLDFKSVPSQTLQDVCARVNKALGRFLKGDKNGKRSGKPRFKNQARYRTLKLEGQAVTIERVGLLCLFLSIGKLKGWVKIKLHRPLPDGFTLKNVLVTKKADGWYFTLCIEDPSVPEFNPDNVTATWDNSMGIDAVLHEDDYLATSENTKLSSRKSYRKSEKKLAKLQLKKSKAKRGSKANRKLAKRVAKLHQNIQRSRKDHAYKTAHQLVKSGKKVFFVENLNLQGLSKRNKVKQDENGNYLPNGQSASSGLNKSWSDAAFGQFFTILENIAGKAGAKIVKVKPQYTSMVLSYRDEVRFPDCNVREYWDENEQLLVDRDVNSAVNIKRVGLELFPTIKRRRGKKGSSEVVFTNSKTASTSKQVLETLKEVPEAYTVPAGSV